MNVVLRADASVAMGSGHLRRCLALAHALRDLGAHCLFVCRPLGMDVDGLVEGEGFALAMLPTASESCADAADAADTLALLARRGLVDVPLVLVDHYALQAPWHRRIAAGLGCSVAAIDDLADRDLAVSCLVDPNPALDHRLKYAGRLPASARLLGGPRYALLAPAYRDAPRCAVAHPVQSIGIFMGGTDPGGFSAAALIACRERVGFDGPIEVVSTRANPQHAALAQLVTRWSGTTLTLDLPDLAAFFARHGLHIGAGGGASWERCCIGAPTLVLQAADNQAAVVPQLRRLGVAATLAELTEAAMDQAFDHALTALLADAPLRQALSQRSQALVDGNGARRVAAALLAPALRVRKATAADRERLLAWRNHAATRAVSLSAQEIDAAAHTAWLARTLADPTRQLLVGCIGEQPVGVIRFDQAPGADRLEAEVSLYLDPALHGLGLGPHLLAAGERAARAWAGESLGFLATVLDRNPGSQRLFAAGGYRLQQGLWRKPAPVSHHQAQEATA